ncbi:hypothetical protein LQZ18_18260 [Lachnospiraceae bacterium ZAX-1]
MVIEKICPICKKQFESTRQNAKYCSDECRIKSRKKERKPSKLPTVEEFTKTSFEELGELHRFLFPKAKQADEVAIKATISVIEARQKLLISARRGETDETTALSKFRNQKQAVAKKNKAKFEPKGR